MSVSSTIKLFDNFSSPLRKVFDSLDKVLISFESLDKVSSNIDLSSPINSARKEIGVFNQTLDEMGQKLNQNTDSTSNLFDSFKRMASVTALLAGAKTTISQNLGFDDEKRKAVSISGDIGRSSELDKYTTMYAAGGLTKTDIAKGYQYTSLAGWNFDESTFAMPIMTALQKTTGAEFGQISDLVTDSLTPLGLSVAQLPDFADQMARTQNISNTNMEQMLNAYIGGAFTGVKTGQMDIPQLNAVLGVLANAGIKGAEAGTQVRNLMNGLYDTSSKTTEILNAMGLSAYNQDGSAANGFELLKDFGTKMQQYNDASRKQVISGLFNVYDEKGVNAIMTQINLLDEYQNKITNSEGALNEMVNIMDGGMGGAMRNMKSNFSTWMIGIGQSFEPLLYIAAIITQTDMFGGLLIGLQMLIGTISTVAFMFSWLLSILNVLSPVLLILITLKLALLAAEKLKSLADKDSTRTLGALLGIKGYHLAIDKKSISTALTALPLKIKELFIDIARISPLLAIITVVAAVIVVLGIVMQKFDGLRRAVVWVVDGIIDMINGLLDKLAGIPIIGDHITKSRLTGLDEDTAFKFTNPFDSLMPELPELPESPEEPELPELPQTPKSINVGDVGTVGKVKSVESEVDISDDDIKLMRDVAMKEALVQYNTYSLNNSNSFGDIHETADVNNVIEKITEMFEEGVAVSTELSHNYS